MTADDRPAFATALSVLGEVFRQRVSDVQARAYWEALVPYSLANVQRAIGDAIRQETSFPVPATLLRRIGYDGCGPLSPPSYRPALPPPGTGPDAEPAIHGAQWNALIQRIVKKDFPSQHDARAAIDDLAEECGLERRHSGARE